jgi:hypothetical protein
MKVTIPVGALVGRPFLVNVGQDQQMPVVCPPGSFPGSEIGFDVPSFEDLESARLGALHEREAAQQLAAKHQAEQQALQQAEVVRQQQEQQAFQQAEVARQQLEQESARRQREQQEQQRRAQEQREQLARETTQAQELAQARRVIQQLQEEKQRQSQQQWGGAAAGTPTAGAFQVGGAFQAGPLPPAPPPGFQHGAQPRPLFPLQPGQQQQQQHGAGPFPPLPPGGAQGHAWGGGAGAGRGHGGGGSGAVPQFASGGPSREDLLAMMREVVHLQGSAAAVKASPAEELRGLTGIPFVQAAPVHKVNEASFCCEACTGDAKLPGGFGKCDMCRRQALDDPSITNRHQVWLKQMADQPVFVAQPHAHNEARVMIASLREDGVCFGDYDGSAGAVAPNELRLGPQVQNRVKAHSAQLKKRMGSEKSSKGKKARYRAGQLAIEEAAETNALGRVVSLCVSALEEITSEMGAGGSSGSSSSGSAAGANSWSSRIQYVARNMGIVKDLFHQGTLQSELTVHKLLARSMFVKTLPTPAGVSAAMEMFDVAARGGVATGPVGSADTPLTDKVCNSIVKRVQKMGLPKPTADEEKDREILMAAQANAHSVPASLLGKVRKREEDDD